MRARDTTTAQPRRARYSHSVAGNALEIKLIACCPGTVVATMAGGERVAKQSKDGGSSGSRRTGKKKRKK
jgi:hypothetical protein